MSTKKMRFFLISQGSLKPKKHKLKYQSQIHKDSEIMTSWVVWSQNHRVPFYYLAKSGPLHLNVMFVYHFSLIYIMYGRYVWKRSKKMFLIEDDLIVTTYVTSYVIATCMYTIVHTTMFTNISTLVHFRATIRYSILFCAQQIKNRYGCIIT